MANKKDTAAMLAAAKKASKKKASAKKKRPAKKKAAAKKKARPKAKPKSGPAQPTDDHLYAVPTELLELAEKCMLPHVWVVQAIVAGKHKSNAEAYRSVYTDCSFESSHANVARMLVIDSVRELYQALRGFKFRENVLSRDQAMSILSDMASTSLDDLVEFSTNDLGEDVVTGQRVIQSTWKFKDSAALTPAHLRSISELNASSDGLKIKQHDQKAAIKQLSAMAGWDVAKKLPTKAAGEGGGDGTLGPAPSFVALLDDQDAASAMRKQFQLISDKHKEEQES